MEGLVFRSPVQPVSLQATKACLAEVAARNGILVRRTMKPLSLKASKACTMVEVAQPVLHHGVMRRRRVDNLGVRCNASQGHDDSEDYVEAHVMEAVKLVPMQGQLVMTLHDGREIVVNHVNPSKGHLLYKGSTPTIFLKMTDGSDLMLPIVVGRQAVAMLMKGMHEFGMVGRPNQYQILKELVDRLNFETRMVRLTERVSDTYYARIYFGKPGDDELLSVDARPSDAINLAVRCKIPIYVHKSILAADAIRPVYVPDSCPREKAAVVSSREAFLDSTKVEPDLIAEEINLMRNMLMAVMEERYLDAAYWRDELTTLRAAAERQIRQT